MRQHHIPCISLRQGTRLILILVFVFRLQFPPSVLPHSCLPCAVCHPIPFPVALRCLQLLMLSVDFSLPPPCAPCLHLPPSSHHALQPFVFLSSAHSLVTYNHSLFSYYLLLFRFLFSCRLLTDKPLSSAFLAVHAARYRIQIFAIFFHMARFFTDVAKGVTPLDRHI